MRVSTLELINLIKATVCLLILCIVGNVMGCVWPAVLCAEPTSTTGGTREHVQAVLTVVGLLAGSIGFAHSLGAYDGFFYNFMQFKTVERINLEAELADIVSHQATSGLHNPRPCGGIYRNFGILQENPENIISASLSSTSLLLLVSVLLAGYAYYVYIYLAVSVLFKLCLIMQAAAIFLQFRGLDNKPLSEAISAIMMRLLLFIVLLIFFVAAL